MVDELSSSMLATTSSSCTALQTPEASNTAYTGWIPLMNTGGQLVALVRNPAGGAGIDYTASLTVNTAGVRQAAGGLFYLDRNYRITNTTVSTPVDVQLFFTSAELAALAAADPNATLGNLNVTKQTGAACVADFDAVNGTNSLLPQNFSNAANGVTWLQVQTSSFSNFYVMAGTSPLTVELGEISAVNVGSRNRVDWNTLSEHNGDYFIVERSADGIRFNAIGTVNGKGMAASYSYWDENPVSGKNHYRLKMMDAAGNFAYSEVVTATVKGSGKFTVEAFPNPVGNEMLTVNVWGKTADNATLTVSDVTGKIVTVVSVVNNHAEINMSGMAQGVYLVRYSDAIQSETIKINKQ
jgi:hypothetical protein